jgi:transcription elongation factor Elf1
MNIDLLRETLKKHNLFVKETRKNILSICVFCGDHKNSRKRGHLYISIDSKSPVCHCFLCGKSTTIRTLLKSVTEDNKIIDEVISNEEQAQNFKNQKSTITKKEIFKTFQVPLIDFESYIHKRLYIKQRTCNGIECQKIPNLIFDFTTFFKLNNIDIVGNGDDKQLSNYEFDYIQKNFIGFLSRNQSMLYCRNCDQNSNFKFKKIVLQNNNGLLDYWKLDGFSNSNTIVLSEGNFNILSYYCFDFLGIKNDVRVYAAGNSFSYSSLLKSVCYDEDLYSCDVIILSDTDKEIYHYKKFIEENRHIINSLQIWGNKNGKDFGEFPVNPFQYKDLKFQELNKYKKPESKGTTKWP